MSYKSNRSDKSDKPLKPKSPLKNNSPSSKKSGYVGNARDIIYEKYRKIVNEKSYLKKEFETEINKLLEEYEQISDDYDRYYNDTFLNDDDIIEKDIQNKKEKFLENFSGRQLEDFRQLFKLHEEKFKSKDKAQHTDKVNPNDKGSWSKSRSKSSLGGKSRKGKKTNKSRKNTRKHK